ncbi:MAG: hypothetical protein Q9161_004473 [Pseudevernia consocians]
MLLAPFLTYVWTGARRRGIWRDCEGGIPPRYAQAPGRSLAEALVAAGIYDGGVCSFLGTVDPDFDPDHTLAGLENTQRERLKARRAEFEARGEAGTGNLVDGDSGDYPQIKIEEAKLVAVASTRAESEMILGKFLADVFEDLDNE